MPLKLNSYFFFAIIPILTQFINSNISKWPNYPCQIFFSNFKFFRISIFLKFQIFSNFKFFEISNFFEFQIFSNFKYFKFQIFWISNFSNFKFFQTSKFQNFQIFSWQPLARTPQKNSIFIYKFDFQNLISKFVFSKKFEIRKNLKFEKIWNLKNFEIRKKIWQGQFGHFERL